MNVELFRGKGIQLQRIHSNTLCVETLSFGIVLRVPLTLIVGIQVLMRSTHDLNFSKFDSADISDKNK